MRMELEPTDLLDLDEEQCCEVLKELAQMAQGAVESRSFSDCSYLSCKALGVQIRLIGGKADVVFLYNEVEGFQRFQGSLPEAGHERAFSTVFEWFSFVFHGFQSFFDPFQVALQGLQWSHVSKDVILLLGEPSEKYGGGRFRPVGISYETLGLDIQFKESSWEDEKNPISFISVFERLDPHHGLCELLARFRITFLIARSIIVAIITML